MSQSGFKTGFATRRELEVRRHPQHLQRLPRASREELEVKLAALQKDYAEIHTAIFEAAQVHRRLCARRLVAYGDFEIASEIFAVRHIPGDFFTIKARNDGVIFALGDISGKGLAAGMWTTHLVGLVGAHVDASIDPESIVAGVNRDLCRMESDVPLASLFLARLDPASGRLDYCSAGHPPALLLRASGELELLSDGGLLLGVVQTAKYVSGCVELAAGDVLMVYSDGINESLNELGEEFGYARLKKQLQDAPVVSADSVLFSVLGAVQDFAAGGPLADDMSLVVLRRDT